MNPQELSGVLVIDKPEGLSSTEVVEKVKSALRVKKAGHGGTLDPIATGVLPIFLNQATKVAQIFLEGDKAYEGEFQLGITTDTYDITGELLARRPVPSLSIQRLTELAKSFEGDLEQMPPPYSAAKYRGRPLYKYARDGLFIPKEPKKVKIYEFKITSFVEDRVGFYLRCSKGTYVRSLIHRLGEILECGATLVRLRRTQKSIFTISMTITLEEILKIAKENPEGILKHIIGLEKALEFLPKIVLSEELSKKIREGRQIPRHVFLSLLKFQKLTVLPSDKWIRLLDPYGKLVAIIENPLLDSSKQNVVFLRVFKGEI